MLVTKVTDAFPNLAFSNAEIDDRGGDHRVLLLDRTYAFRFPRGHDNNLRMEIAVLAALEGQVAISTPRYEFVAPNCSFAGYRFLDGDELTPALFASLPESVQKHVVDQAIQLVNVLHGLVPGAIAEPSAWRTNWTARQFAERGRARLEASECLDPRLAEAILQFYARYETDLSPVQVVLHGDLVEDHLLLSRDRDGLAGVLDFGDVALGDPAEDLKGFWTYGTAAARYAIAKSTYSSTDPALLERSRRAYLRYRIDRCIEQLADFGLQPAAASEAQVLLSLLSTDKA